jgi:hypothetical protein
VGVEINPLASRGLGLEKDTASFLQDGFAIC